jgi:hypothetical protein
MYCQQSGAPFRRFIPRFRRFGGYRLTAPAAVNTLASLAAHSEMRRYEKTVDPGMAGGCPDSAVLSSLPIVNGAIMRIKQVLAFLGAAAVSSLALADSNTVVVQGKASPLVHLTTQQAQDATGSFRLDDGRTLRLTSHNNKVFMEVDGKREELLPVSQTRFVARGSGAELALDDLTFPQKVELTQYRR